MSRKREAKPIGNATGQKLPGVGGVRKKPNQVRDVVEEIETRPDRELDDLQAGGEEPW
jgi:hypothetical protein